MFLPHATPWRPQPCQRGWSAQRIHDSDTSCRIVIRSADAGILVDLAVNAPPDLPLHDPAGPTLAPEELAGHKLLALFDRAGDYESSPAIGGYRVLIASPCMRGACVPGGR